MLKSVLNEDQKKLFQIPSINTNLENNSLLDELNRDDSGEVEGEIGVRENGEKAEKGENRENVCSSLELGKESLSDKARIEFDLITKISGANKNNANNANNVNNINMNKNLINIYLKSNL